MRCRFGVLAFACVLGAGPSCAPVVPAKPGTAQNSGGALEQSVVEVDNRVGWPYTLTDLYLQVDGFPRVWETIHGSDSVRRVVPLRVEGYEASVLARFVVAGRSAAECTVEVTLSRGVEVDALPAKIHWDLYLRDVTHSFVERPEIGFSLEGAHRVPLPVATIGAFDDLPCRHLRGVARALCRADAAAAEGRRTRDAILALCASDIGGQIRASAVEVRGIQRRGPVAEAAPQEQERLAVLLAKIEADSARLDRCVPDIVKYGDETIRHSARGSCESDAPFEPAQASE